MREEERGAWRKVRCRESRTEDSMDRLLGDGSVDDAGARARACIFLRLRMCCMQALKVLFDADVA
jgi:hypothetical protein